MKHNFYHRLFSILFVVCVLAACASDDDKDKAMPDKPVEELYNSALNLMDKHSYKEAAKMFEEVERQHPYSQWATRAELMEAFAQYQDLDYAAANGTLDQFIEVHPGNNEIAYAYYLKALCSYEQIADVRRDQGFAHDALKQLGDVITRFPDTVYAKDAALKIVLVNDHLAGAEMEVGRYYLKMHLYTAAVGRFRTVVEKYQTTSHAPEALERLVECYLALGIPSEAKATGAVLSYNFPGSPWYADAYALLVRNNLTPEVEEGSWISRIWPNF